MNNCFEKSDQALKRMKKAYDKGKGVLIKADELQELGLTLLGEWWDKINLTHNEPDLTELAVKSEKPSKPS